MEETLLSLLSFFHFFCVWKKSHTILYKLTRHNLQEATPLSYSKEVKFGAPIWMFRLNYTVLLISTKEESDVELGQK